MVIHVRKFEVPICAFIKGSGALFHLQLAKEMLEIV